MEVATARNEREHLRGIAEADVRLLRDGAITKQQQLADEWAARQADEKVQAAEARAADLARRNDLVDRTTRDLTARVQMLDLRSPGDGIVYNLPRSAGESVAAGQLVATVTDPAHIRVRARVDSPDLPRVRAGQTLIVTFDGLPGQRWRGSVVLVPPGLREVGGREVGEVIGELEGDAAALPSNASVNVQIIVGERASALVVPRGALVRDGATRSVFRLVDGQARKTPISVGLVGASNVEVLGGLREGDRVILPGTAPLHDGDAVRASSGR